MIITLKGANFASSNIGTLDSWLISKSLTGVTIDNTATSVKKGEAYKAVITLKENYTFPDTITVTMGGTDITSTYVTKTSTTITINIPSVTGNIVIRVNATSNVVGVTYSITRTLTALTAGSNVNTITSGDTYEETFSIPKDMYDGYAGASGVEVDLTVKMGGSTLVPNTGAFTAELVYQQVSGVERATGFKVTVPNVSGNIAITATSYVPFNESIADTKVHHYTVKDKSIDIDGVSIGDVLIYANVPGAKVHGWSIPAGAKLTVTYKNTKAILSSEAMVLLHKTSNNVLDYKSTYIAAAGIGSTSTFTFTNVYNDEVLLEANEGVIVSGRYTVVGGGITPGEEGGNDDDITLDSIAYGGKTYREVFENGNKITTGNMITDNSIDSWTQFNTTPRVTVATAEYCTPSSAVDSTCTASAQVYKAIPGGLISGHKYYMACKRKLTAYTKGTWCGFQTTDASNSDALIAGRDICNTFAISNEFVTLSKIYSMSATYNNARYWMGCGGSANLTAYIDDLMLIDLTEVFGSNIPSEAEMNVLYDKFLVMHGATIEVVDKPTSLDDIAHDNISYRTLFLNNNELNGMDMIDNTAINLTQYETYPIPTVDNSVYNTPSVSMNISGTKSTQGYKTCDIGNNHNYFMGFNRNITAKTTGTRAGIWFTEEGQTGGTNASAEGLAVTNGWETRTYIYKYPGTKTKGMIWVGSGGGANLTGHIDDLVFIDLTKVFGDNIPSSSKMQQLYKNFVELCKNN